MNDGDWFLIGVVAVAFIAGYSIVSFIVRKMKSQQQPGNADQAQGDQSQGKETKSEGSTEDSERSEAKQAGNQQDQHRQWEQGQARRRNETWESQSEERRYARVLGLRGKVTAEDVKRAYRELLAKYHPDKVNHLGDEFKNIAEAKTRGILEAYDYFRKKYDIR